jgi:hypothetical protein
MRNLFTILFAFLVSSCMSSDTHPIAPSAAPFPNLTLLVKVSGDPRTGNSMYPVTFDGSPSVVLQPNVEATLVVPAGNHAISLGLPLRALSWCIPVGPSSFSGTISGDAVTKVIFSLDCPPLVGAGKLQLSLSGSGSGTPALVGVILTKLNAFSGGFVIDRPLRIARFEPPPTSSFTVPTDKPFEVTMSAGLYSIYPVLPTNCLRSVVPGSGVPVVAIRDGSTATVSISYSCS